MKSIIFISLVLFLILTRSNAQIEKDPVPGTCEQFVEYIISKGVAVMIDGEAQHRKGKAASTGKEVYYTTQRGLVTKRTTSKYKCPCDKKTYDDITTCTNKCHVSLGCFTNICNEEVIQVCLTTALDVEFIAETKVYRVDWKPVGNISQACKAALIKWYQRLETHENKHVEFTQQELKFYNEKWKKDEEFEECGTTEAEAMQKLNKRIDDFIKNQLDAERDDLQKKSIKKMMHSI